MPTENINFPESLEKLFYFLDNQVLTAGQLNQLAGHFDHQQRLTRSKAIGIGILNGLELQIVSAGNEIHISKGSAITTDGDLIHLAEPQVYRYARLLQDENTEVGEVDDTRILKLGYERKPVPMWQLHAASVDGGIPLSDLRSLPDFSQFVVVLYLDSWLRKEDNCSELNCDKTGLTQINDILAVLIPRQYLQPAGNSPNHRRNLPAPGVRRVDLTQGTITGVTELLNRFETAVEQSAPGLAKALTVIPKRFPGLLDLAFGPSSPADQWIEKILALPGEFKNNRLITCVYDFYEDLALALRELWDTLPDIHPEYCPSGDCFPKYIMLGEISPAANSRYADFRHYFVSASPEADQTVRKAVFLLKRIDCLIKAFKPDQPMPVIRITPSRKTVQKLGDKAIPAYYVLNSRVPLSEYWSYEKSRSGQEDANQGYWMQDISPLDQVKNPFLYTADAYDFFRVEGMIGMDIDQAEKSVDGLRRTHNLGFRIETVQIEDNVSTVRPFKPIPFPDLNLAFELQKEDLLSSLQLTDHYFGSVKKAFDTVAASPDFDNLKDPDGTDVRTNLKVALEDNRIAFTNEVGKLTTRINTSLQDFQANFGEFRKDFDKATNLAQQIENKIGYAKQSTAVSPVRKLVLENSSRRFDLIREVFDKRKELLLRQYIFDRFYNTHPGLSHEGGVPAGGTLVLVYSSTNRQVVADFCLPYFCQTEIREEDRAVTPGPIKPLPGIIFNPAIEVPDFKWVDKIDPLPIPRIPKDVLNLNKLVQDKVNAASASYFETAFNNKIVAALPNIFSASPGKSGGTVLDPPFNPNPGGVIRDLDLRLDVERANWDAERVLFLESIPVDKRTNDEKTELNRLKEQLVGRTGKILEKAAGGDKDLEPGSDEWSALEGLAVVLEKTKTIVEHDATIKKAETVLTNSTNTNLANKTSVLNNVLNRARK